ncbi:Maf family protein [Jeotgalibacillus haloalkalitolerans]|uniref:dTTP/UTP pyrophosphatase n=1 Tax=Jeotgalibacillus haloalkalitolerans TaxID=3104292 RepID=A0ABU5KMG9_9BACL|nr:Maf family protein [Jeotgalibacillus sp. HH7-29]MDZ5712360.1 Maf family protein [Jeotgalibacillus sp. HH7-29]
MNMEIILASQSPRRKELMSLLPYPFKIHPSAFDESTVTDQDPETAVLKIAEGKAMDIAAKFPEAVVIGSDTIVYQEKILGKPKTAEEAADMLKSLSGRTHTVYTGVVLMRGQETVTFTEQTDVTFWPLSDEEINNYVATPDPYDKAGAYGIQSGGALFVKAIRGDYYAVVGLPVARLKRELQSFLSCFQP